MFNLCVAWILRLQLRLIAAAAAAFQGRWGRWTAVSGEDAAAPELHPAEGGGLMLRLNLCESFMLIGISFYLQRIEEFFLFPDWKRKNKTTNSRWWRKITANTTLFLCGSTGRNWIYKRLKPKFRNIIKLPNTWNVNRTEIISPHYFALSSWGLTSHPWHPLSVI